jgi:hypothetical protein
MTHGLTRRRVSRYPAEQGGRRGNALRPSAFRLNKSHDTAAVRLSLRLRATRRRMLDFYAGVPGMGLVIGAA